MIDSIIEERINYLNCPTPTRLMGKPKEEVEKWRIEMNEKDDEKNKRKK